MNIDQLLANRGKNRRYVTQGVLAEAQAAADKAAAEKVKTVLMGMFGTFDDEVDAAVDLVKDLRKQATKQGKYAEKLSRAVAYFNAHGNPLPVYALLEGGKAQAADFYRRAGLGELPEDGDEAWIVPADFVEPAQPAA
jgi:hypothetical protein